MWSNPLHLSNQYIRRKPKEENKASKQQDTTKIQPQKQQKPTIGLEQKRMEKFPFMIYGEDHYTKDFPHHD